MAEATSRTLDDFETEVLVIGGGMGGVCAMYRLRQAGYQPKMIEAAPYLGGVWRWNNYPGARVDSECPFYQLQIPEVWKTWLWKERFPGHEELKEYFAYCDKQLGLSKDCYFDTVVEGVEQKDGKWVCNIRGGGIVTCKHLLLCTGSSYKKHFPDFKGLEKFQGILLHSAAYPEKGLDVRGKRVAVVGNGATGVQVVQELGKEDCDLTVFIRTPNICFPMKQRKLSVEEQVYQKGFYKMMLESGRKTRAGFPMNVSDEGWYAMTPEKRRERMEYYWNLGGFAFLMSSFREFLIDKEVNAIFYDFWKEKIHARIKDPVKREIVAPSKQEHWFGTKRPSLEQDYLEVLDRPNVKLVNLKKAPIQEFTEKGIVTDQLHEFDVIILCTGYDSMTGSLMDLQIKDTDGELLQDKWSKGVETYLGLTIHKMPNMFMVYSPQAPTALSNGPPIIEIQVEWIIKTIQKMKKEGIDSISAEDAPAKKWRQDIQDMNSKTLYPLENSWYMGANIPGKVREQLVYLGGLDTYDKEINAALDDWKGFQVAKNDGVLVS